jgi:beta-xylosidase
VAEAEAYHCVGTAVADAPSGPYVPLPEPFACDLTIGGAIDASGFVDSDGSRYVLYKVDGNSIGNGGDCGNSVPPLVATPIMLQAVETDGTTTVGELVQILDRGDSDGPLVEAPSLILRDGIYYLFFSSHCFTSPEYDVRYATSESLTGPYTKAEGALLITGDWGLDAPGGATVSDDGDMIMFHANCAAGRCSFIGELGYDGTTVSVV